MRGVRSERGQEWEGSGVRGVRSERGQGYWSFELRSDRRLVNKGGEL